jgi:hypothetical protein
MVSIRNDIPTSCIIIEHKIDDLRYLATKAPRHQDLGVRLYYLLFLQILKA